MFSQGLSSLKKAASTDTRFTCLRTDNGSATTSHPKTVARPASGVSSVPRIRMSVDFPLPFGPRMPVMPPGWMTRSSSWSATLSFHSRRHQGAPVSRSRRLNALVMPCSSMAADVIGLLLDQIRFQKKKDRGGAQLPHGPLWFLESGYRIGLNVRSEGRLRPRRSAPSWCRPLTYSSQDMDTPGWV